MSNELIIRRREFLKKRFVSSTVQLSVVLALSLYNCIAELLFPAFAVPVSFYIPQFIITMANRLDLPEKAVLYSLLLVLAAAILTFIAVCLILSRRHYTLVSFMNVAVSIDMILLIYVGLQSLVINGFDAFFVINLFVHIWMLVLVIRLRRASEGLEVLPEVYEQNE